MRTGLHVTYKIVFWCLSELNLAQGFVWSYDLCLEIPIVYVNMLRLFGFKSFPNYNYLFRPLDMTAVGTIFNVSYDGSMYEPSRQLGDALHVSPRSCVSINAVGLSVKRLLGE